ncbi:hypothetical protein PL321_10045 [Caloramator sp. mosi_1]|uniref:hypothetical protein n=1 Tax=Caloramator sp. mosi_1 TaxID=3023090 RepID=UPI0023618D32|nr:hypothetical protein [Caloramator sp. mosi_1]WDC83163.1 hypothetical protein PL321_10045 [Caloramator sp. mosi_1]
MKTQIYNLLGGIGLLIFSLGMLSHSSQNYFSYWFHNQFKQKTNKKYIPYLKELYFLL